MLLRFQAIRHIRLQAKPQNRSCTLRATRSRASAQSSATARAPLSVRSMRVRERVRRSSPRQHRGGDSVVVHLHDVEIAVYREKAVDWNCIETQEHDAVGF